MFDSQHTFWFVTDMKSIQMKSRNLQDVDDDDLCDDDGVDTLLVPADAGDIADNWTGFVWKIISACEWQSFLLPVPIVLQEISVFTILLLKLNFLLLMTSCTDMISFLCFVLHSLNSVLFACFSRSSVFHNDFYHSRLDSVVLFNWLEGRVEHRGEEGNAKINMKKRKEKIEK